MDLIDLDDGGVSLEFEEAEANLVLARLRDALRAAGVVEMQRTSGATLDIIAAGGHRFVWGAEPDESCLIAVSPGADRFLRTIALGGADRAA